MLAGRGHILDDEGMRIGAGGDQDGLDVLVSQQFVIILHHTLDAALVGHSLGHIQADIADRDQIRFGDETAQGCAACTLPMRPVPITAIFTFLVMVTSFRSVLTAYA